MKNVIVFPGNTQNKKGRVKTMIKRFTICILVLTFLNLTIIAPVYADDNGQIVSNCIIGLTIITLVAVIVYVYKSDHQKNYSSEESKHPAQISANSQSDDPDKRITPSKSISFSEQSSSSPEASKNQNSDSKKSSIIEDKLISPSGELVVFRW
jgi:Ca2+/Na+ antiporter